MKEVTIELLCELDDVELGHRAQALSLTTLRIDEVEAEKAGANKEFKEELDQLRKGARKLSLTLRSRTETRPVQCIVEYNSPTPGSKRIARKDTGEFYRDEPMTPDECQTHLFDRGEVSVEDLAQRVQATGATEIVLAVLEKLKGDGEVDESIDNLLAPLRDGTMTEMSFSYGDETVTVGKAQAEKIHKRVLKHQRK